MKRALLVGLALLLLCGGVFYLRPLEVLSAVTAAALRLHGAHSRYDNVGGYRVHSWEMDPPHESASSPKLLLIHGLGGQALDWAAVMPVFARAGYHVFAVDLLGFGDSARADIAYSPREQMEMVYGYAQARGIARSDVVGWSMGGWVAMLYAVEHPDRVHRLVLDDSAGVDFTPSFDPVVFTPRTTVEFRVLGRLLEPKAPVVPWFIARDFLRRSRQRCCVVARAVHAMESREDVMDTRLPQLKVPALVNWGADDLLIPLDVGRRTAQLIPGADLNVFDGCAHLAPVRCANRVSSATLSFLQSADPPSGVVREILAK